MKAKNITEQPSIDYVNSLLSQIDVNQAINNGGRWKLNDGKFLINVWDSGFWDNGPEGWKYAIYEVSDGFVNYEVMLAHGDIDLEIF